MGDWLLALVVAVLAPPLIALRWDGSRLSRLREAGSAAGRDPAAASTANYLRRGMPSFLIATVAILIGVLVNQQTSIGKPLSFAVVSPMFLIALALQRRSVRSMEREMFGR